MKSDDFQIMRAEAGEGIAPFAHRMAVRADATDMTVLGEHNQHTLEASPGMSVRGILAAWNAAQRDSYVGREGAEA